MKSLYLRAVPFVLAFDNSIQAFIPELWAQEGLAILEENMVMANLVHRDFENEIAIYGETVNTRKPGEFEAKRKGVNDDVEDQAATATNVEVKLNQHPHVSILIRDGEESKSMTSLVAEYLKPAMLAQARFVDEILLGQWVQFYNQSAGRLNVAGTTGELLEMRQILNENKAYMQGRNLILNPNTETDFLKLDIFTQAQQVGDNGTALREASLGKKYGFETFMCQNMASILAGNTVVTGAINNAAGYPAGTTSLTIDGLSAALPVNSWFTVAGDDTPQRIISSTGGATPTAVVCYPGLKRAVVDNAVITRYAPGAVNLGAGYAVGHSKAITVDGFSVAPQAGQMVTFGTSTSSDRAVNPHYTIIGTPTTTSILLDRPLEVALADNDTVNIGPAGNVNFAFHKNAIALVTRPLALPQSGTGARAAVINYNGLSMRVVITYDGKAQGHRVVLDFLCGVKVLDTALGAVLYA